MYVLPFLFAADDLAVVATPKGFLAFDLLPPGLQEPDGLERLAAEDERNADLLVGGVVFNGRHVVTSFRTVWPARCGPQWFYSPVGMEMALCKAAYTHNEVYKEQTPLFSRNGHHTIAK